MKSSTLKSLLHKIVHRSFLRAAGRRGWPVAAAVYFSLALAVQAVSPSISPWETILSSDSTGAAEGDQFLEARVSGQTIHAVWVSNTGFDLNYLCYRRSLDGGATWQERTILETNSDWQRMQTGDYANHTTRLAVDGDNVHVIQQRSDGIHYYRSTNSGASFDPVNSLPYGDTPPRIAAAGGRVTMAYGSGASGHILLSTNNGSTFTHTQVLDDRYGPYDYNWPSFECCDLKAAADKLASIWHIKGSSRFVAVTSTNSGAIFYATNFTDLRTDSWVSNPSIRPQLCAITGDTFHMAWNQRNTNGRSAFFYARSLDGGVTFEPARDMSEGTIGTDEVRAGQMVMVTQGTRVYLCYIANSSGGVWLRSSADSGATFGAAIPLHIPGSSFLGNGEVPNVTIDPHDATGDTAWFAYAVPSAYGGCSASAVGHTSDGGATVSPLLAPAHPWAWGNGYPYNFLLLPASSPVGTQWTMLYVGSRPGYDPDIFARKFVPEPDPATNNQVLHLAGLATSQRYDLLEVPSVPSLQFSNTLTVEMWVRVTPGALMDRGLEILQWGKFDSCLAFRGYASGGGNFTVSAPFHTTAGTTWVGGAPIIGDGGWHHFALTYDANGGPLNLRFYADGHLYNTATVTGSFTPAAEPLMVGGILSGWGLDPLNGDVKNLRLWNRALSEDEIRASARQAVLTGSESGLAAAFSFNGTVKDLSGHGADGLLQFGATYQNSASVPAPLMTEWVDDLSSNTVRPSFWRTNSGATLFTADASHGDLRLSKPSGTTGGFTLDSVWRAVGDFDVSFDFRDAALTRSADWGNHLGIHCIIGSTTYYTWRSDESQLGQNVRFGVEPGWWANGVRNTNAAAGNLRLIRRGTQLSSYWNGELTYQTTCETNPMTCRLELLNNGTPDAISATFDNFKIAATGLESRWNAFDSYAAYVAAKGLSGADADPAADPDADGAANLWEYAAGTDATSAISKPATLAIGTQDMGPTGKFLTVTTRLVKPVPADLNVTAEFTMDLTAPGPWMFTDIVGTDTDQGDHIDRTFRAPLLIGSPETGFMRVKITQP